MNDLQKAYIDGASMAYKDVADKMYQMIDDAPPELAGMFQAFAPFAATIKMKSEEIYCEAGRMDGVKQ